MHLFSISFRLSSSSLSFFICSFLILPFCCRLLVQLHYHLAISFRISSFHCFPPISSNSFFSLYIHSTYEHIYYSLVYTSNLIHTSFFLCRLSFPSISTLFLLSSSSSYHLCFFYLMSCLIPLHICFHLIFFQQPTHLSLLLSSSLSHLHICSSLFLS